MIFLVDLMVVSQCVLLFFIIAVTDDPNLELFSGNIRELHLGAALWNIVYPRLSVCPGVNFQCICGHALIVLSLDSAPYLGSISSVSWVSVQPHTKFMCFCIISVRTRPLFES